MTGLRRGAQTLGAATVAATVFCGLAATGVVVAVRSTLLPPPDGPVAAPLPATAPGRAVVAFVAGSSGTTASDLLAPYDIFASSLAFTTYVAAEVSARDAGRWTGPGGDLPLRPGGQH